MSKYYLVSVGLMSGLFLTAGCMSTQNQSQLDKISGQTVSNSPFVEAYIEYASPQSKWVGPSSFILHVTAKDGDQATVQTVPQLFVKAAPAANIVHERTPASEHSVNESALKTIPAAFAREQIADLAKKAQDGPDPEFKGCTSPLRLRLIRADGGLVEKVGCRGLAGWSKESSETVARVLEKSLASH